MAGDSRDKQKRPRGAASSKSISDSRFSQFENDPRYRLPSRKDTHVKVDKRFSRMLNDDDFVRKAKVDRYGRRISSAAGKKAIQKLYDFEGEEDDEADDDDEVQRELKRVDTLPHDPARQGGYDESSSEEESSSDEDSEADVEEEIEEQVDPDSGDILTGEVTSRLAVVNLDWDNIRAVDLMAVASSFTPNEGRILNVTVYPSEYGRERMEREELEGPDKALFASKSKSVPAQADDDGGEDEEEDDEESESEDDEAIKEEILKQATGESATSEVDGKALRKYQLSRLRFYYAVISCDSDKTAEALYNEMDGSEYLSSANFFDLRFIPDETTFDDPVTDKPRDECNRVPDGYRPNEFVTEALTHSKVNLTWDQDDAGRKEAQKRAFTQSEMDDNDLQAYIGSDSDSAEDEDDDDEAEREGNGATVPGAKQSKKDAARQKMRALLGLPSESDTTKKRSKSDDAPVGGVQITFTAGLTGDDNQPESVFVNKPSDVVEESTRDRYVRKERERKARRKAKSKAARDGVEPANEQEANDADDAEPAPAKEVAESEDPFNDPFFANPDAANKAARKEAKRIQRQERDAKTSQAADRNAKELEELQALMGDEGAVDGDAHFDMAKLRKQQKEAARKGKKKGKRKRTDDEGEQKADTFEMDVQDPRFGRLFESHEYALDPTNARFSDTKGMKQLLNEGRKRREKAGDAAAKGGGKKKGGELDGLVQKIKRRKA